MTGVFEIADNFVGTVAKHNPLAATHMGITGSDHLMPDYSPDATHSFYREIITALGQMEAAVPLNDRERMCKDTFIDASTVSVEQHESRDYLRDINVLFSPVQSVRSIFDLMPKDSLEAWENIASRMEKVIDSMFT